MVRGVPYEAMTDLAATIDTVRRWVVDSGDVGRTVYEYGWAGTDGTVILMSGYGTERDDLLGSAGLIRVSASGEIERYPFHLVMHEIARMVKVGDWPPDEDEAADKLEADEVS